MEMSRKSSGLEMGNHNLAYRTDLKISDLSSNSGFITF